jgi:hypothetical protein
MNALVSGFCAAVFSGFGRRQAHTVYGAPKKAGKAKADKLRGTGVVRYWFDNARPFGTTQGHANVVRWDKVQWR